MVRRVSLLLVALGLAVAPAAAAFKYAEEGKEAPAFALRSLTGDTVRLAERLGAKALAVVFWATWSPRSAAMLDDLEVLLKDRGAQGLSVLAVNVDHEVLSPEDLAAIQALAARWSFPVLLDEGLTAYYAYGVVATPSLALLDEKGTLRYARASYSSSARVDVREAVDGLLGIVPEAASRVAVKKRDYVPPKKATLHYQKAIALIERGTARKAVRDLEQAAELDPAWADPRVLLARVYLAEAGKDLGRLAKAEAVLRQAQAIQPRHLQTLATLAQVLGALGRHGEAVEVGDSALALEPAFTPALLAKARGLRGLGRHGEAGKLLDEALELDPRNPAVFAEKGEVAAALGDHRGAAESLRRAVELGLAGQAGEG